jgi:[acyl-carrier-protein] S-malonyltransferase
MKTVFVFSGQGAQFVGMGKDIFENFHSARAIFESADKALGWSVSGLCFDGPEEKLTQSRFCQPSIFTMSCACLEAFKSAHPQVKPASTAGLSLGEFAALYCAEIFSFENGVKLVAKRGELMDDACLENKGAMASILGGDPGLIGEVCAEYGIDVANLNCPGQIVVSGEAEKVAAAAGELKEKGIKKIIPLKVAGAYHSRLMSGASAKFAKELENVKIARPSVPVAQNIVGGFVNNPDEIKANLAKQVSGSVRWEECAKTICNDGVERMIEFGPGTVLAGLMKRINPAIKTFNINSAKSIADFNWI